MDKQERITPPATKGVEGYFGKTVQLTRDAFIQRWDEHFQSFYRIAESTEDLDTLRFCREKLKAMAGRSWDNLKDNLKG